MSEAHCVTPPRLLGITNEFMASSEIMIQPILPIRWDSFARDAFHGTSSRTRSEGNLWYLRRIVVEGHTPHAAWFYNSRSCPRNFSLKSSEFTASCANSVSCAKLIPRARTPHSARAHSRRWNFCFAFSCRLFSFDIYIAHFRIRARYAPDVLYCSKQGTNLKRSVFFFPLVK